jgi:hypothetical protein
MRGNFRRYGAKMTLLSNENRSGQSTNCRDLLFIQTHQHRRLGFPRQLLRLDSKLSSKVKLLVSIRMARLFLAVSVSLWMAGAGCMFGCSNMTSAVAAIHRAVDQQDSRTVIVGESCHSVRSHDCCAKRQLHAKSARQPDQSRLAFALAAETRGMMKDCPLVLNATAVTSKTNGDLPNPDEALSYSLAHVEANNTQSYSRVTSPFIQNRGPTYLRCCVFLI